MGIHMNPAKHVPDEHRAHILMMAVAMPKGFERADVARRLGVTSSTAYRYMARMREDGAIAATWVGQGARWTTWEKVDALRDELKAEYAQKAAIGRKKALDAYRKRRKAAEAKCAEPAPVKLGPASVFHLGAM